MAGSQYGDVSYTEYETGNQNNQDINFTHVDFVEVSQPPESIL